jgi:hypothetical protein
MKKPLVVGFLGQAGSGKTTAGKHVEKKYDGHRTAFANPLKHLCKAIWDFSDAQVFGSTEDKEAMDPRWNITPRLAMQKLGDGARQFIEYGVWVTAWKTFVLKTYQADPTRRLFVVDDLRYPNEVEEIATSPDFEGYVVKLVCPDAKTSADLTHASEAQVDSIPDRFLAATIISKRSPGSIDLLTKVEQFMNTVVPADGSQRFPMGTIIGV